MTIDEMIERLEEYKSCCANGGLTEIRLATQPNWPFEWTIKGMVSTREAEDATGEESDETNEEEVLYICEGDQIGYLNGTVQYVFNQLRME